RGASQALRGAAERADVVPGVARSPQGAGRAWDAAADHRAAQRRALHQGLRQGREARPHPERAAFRWRRIRGRHFLALAAGRPAVVTVGAGPTLRTRRPNVDKQAIIADMLEILQGTLD